MVFSRPCGDAGVAVLAVDLNTEPIRTLRLRAPDAATASVLERGGTWRQAQVRRDGERLLVDERLAFCEAKAFMLK